MPQAGHRAYDSPDPGFPGSQGCINSRLGVKRVDQIRLVAAEQSIQLAHAAEISERTQIPFQTVPEIRDLVLSEGLDLFRADGGDIEPPRAQLEKQGQTKPYVLPVNEPQPRAHPVRHGAPRPATKTQTLPTSTLRVFASIWTSVLLLDSPPQQPGSRSAASVRDARHTASAKAPSQFPRSCQLARAFGTAIPERESASCSEPRQARSRWPASAPPSPPGRPANECPRPRQPAPRHPPYCRAEPRRTPP